MLRRHSTKSRSDLHRRKSTTSVHSVCLEHLDAAIAQRDAQSAAHHAFNRAKNRRSTDSSLFPQPMGSPQRHGAEPKVVCQGDPTTGDNSRSSGYERIRRHQSVRFVGPDSVLGRTLSRTTPTYTRASVRRGRLGSLDVIKPRESDSLETTKSRGSYPPEPSREAPPLPYSSTVSHDYLQALLAGDEYYTPEDDFASVPSSFRRLRRSKSMFTPEENSDSRRGNARYITDEARGVPGSASSRTPAFRANKENMPPNSTPVLRAPKSMSFLNPRRGYKGSSAHSECGLNTIDYHSGNSQQTKRTQHLSLGSRSLMLHGSKTGRAEFGMRRSLRSSSSNSGMPTAATEPNTKAPAEAGIKTRARKVSHTLKTRLKKLFNLAKTAEEIALPDQHIQSHRSHVPEATRPLSFPGDEEAAWPPSVGGPIYYVPSAIPSIHAAQSHENIHSSKGSVEDLNSYQQRKTSDEKSRVTSWTNSAASTLTSRQQRAWGEWQNQPLPAIEESGSRPLTSSYRAPDHRAHVLQAQERLTGPPNTPEHTTDSERMYSALMKRFHETNPPNQSAEQQNNTPARGQPSVPSALVDEDSPARSTPFSVRRVTPEYNPSGLQVEITGRVAHRVESPDGSSRWPSPDPYAEFPESSSGNEQYLRSPTKLVSHRKELAVSKRASPDGRISFFGSPRSYLFRTVSPYRRALKESIEATESTMGHRDRVMGSDVSDAGTLIHHIVPDEAEYSDSVYSHATNGGEATRSKDSVLLRGEFPEVSSTMGDVSMSVDPPVTYRPTGHRAVSSVSSVDWKTWLSANVAKAEPSPSPSKRSGAGFATPTAPAGAFRRGHVRESAQIEDDDDYEEEGLMATSTRYPAFPATTLGVVEANVVKIPSYQQSIKMVTSCTTRNPTVNSDPRYISEQSGPATNPEGLHTPPILQANNNTPQSSPIYQTNRTVPTTEPGWKSEVRPQPENRIDRHGNSTRRRARIRAAHHVTNSTGSPMPYSVRLRRRKQPLEVEEDVASSPGLTAAVEWQFGGGLGEGENKENEAGAGKELFSTGEGVQTQEGGSKKMVEMFLSSRRRRLVGSDESGVFV